MSKYVRVNKRKIHIIYKTTNLLSGKYYIGMHSTDDLDDEYLGSGDRLKYSIRKHGKENHKREILEFCNSREELVKREKEIINLNEIAKEECLNLCVGGEGGYKYHNNPKGARKFAKAGNDAFIKRLKEDKELSDKFKELGKNTLKHLYKEGLLKFDNFKGKKHTEETKKKMSASLKGKQTGKKNSQFGTCWITNGTENKKIKKKDLCVWLNKGWNKGRNIKYV